MAVSTRSELWSRALELIPGGVNSPVRAMRAVGLDEPLFVRRASGAHFEDAAGERYLDWLGQQLGFQRPEDWARLRATDVLRHRGKGLLKQFRITLIVREFLAGRRVPTTDSRRA